MKKSVSILALIIFSIAFVSSTCSLDVSLINQDPYPAIPGEEVDVVFQITGVQNPECRIVNFEVKEEYPFSIDPGSTNPITINSGTYSKDYSSFYVAPYTLRIDGDALDGDTPLEVKISSTAGLAGILKKFDINIKDTKADFEIYVKDYSYETKTLTFEILNIEDVDVEALTLEIPKQDNVEIKGSNKKVVGDLDSNEYTSADFEAIPKNGEIEVTILYTDSINERRSITKQVEFDSEYFTGRNGDKSFPWFWIIVALGVIVFIFYRRHKKKKDKKKKLHKH